MEKSDPNLNNFDNSSDQTLIISDISVDREDDREAVSTLPVKQQDRYKFIRSIGFGGMKGVLLVHDSDTGRDVAMAIMPDFRTRPRRDLNRFVREAYITAKLEHPNIVPVHDIGIDGSGSPYFTMKYLHGKTLAMILHQRQQGIDNGYSLDRLLQVVVRICNAVAFAHSKDICHLDLKPGNVHCGEFGEVQVLDWGLAAASGDDFDQGLLQGSPGYMSPEFIRSQGMEHPGVAADIYAIGAILYAVLANSTPFPGLPQQEILRRQVEGRITPPSQMNSQVDPGLEAVCMKAMALDPADRYQSVSDLRKEILACIAGYPTRAENPSGWRRMELYIRRNWSMAIIVLLLILVGVMGFFLVKYRMHG